MTPPDQGPNRAQRIGLPLGASLFVLVLVSPAPEGLSPEGWRTAALATLMAVFWVTEAIPIAATALFPIVLLPVLGVVDMKAATAPYAHELVFLQLGGFMLAVAMERWGLHRRLALKVVSIVGTGPRRVVLGFMIAAAFLSMWISNTATTAMMLPIAMAVGALFKPDDVDGTYAFGVCLVLGLAYGATMGGLATLIGTPPNMVLAAQADELLGVEIGFLEWMVVGVPLAAAMIPVGWWLLTRWLYPPRVTRVDAAELIQEQRAALGPVSRGEKTVAIVFVGTALAWMLRAPKVMGAVTVPGIQTWLPNVKDPTIAVAATLALFLIPVDWKKGVFALDWKTARRIPWGILLLFGGGLSLALGMKESGLARWIGESVTGLSGMPTWFVLVVVAALFVFLTEVTSNVATTTMAMPVVASAAVGLGLQPLELMATAALSASMAFMLPVATPPNAIVFGSGYLTIPQMVRAGFLLNLVAIVLVTLAALFLVPVLL